MKDSDGKEYGPQRYIGGRGAIITTYKKYKVPHGLCVVVKKDGIAIVIQKEGKHIFMLAFDGSGKVSLRDDPDKLFDDIQPSMVLK